MRQVFPAPTAEVKDYGVVVLGIGAVVRRFALPYGTPPFPQGIATNSDIVIFASVSLKINLAVVIP